MSKIQRLDLRFFARIIKRKKWKVHEAWNWASNQQSSHWGDIPLVRKRWNYLISGDERISHYEYIIQRYFSSSKDLRALSLGCGAGSCELNWAKSGIFERIDAYDLSELRISHAIEHARKKNYAEILNYQVADIYEVELPDRFYDVVIAEQSLHHFSPLEKIIHRVKKWLKRDGYFIVNEFVGPTRFQWTDRQLEIANSVLSILPAKYRMQPDGKSVKKIIFRPSLLRMIHRDPSEAIESSRIMPLLRQYFNLVDIRPYGGTILHLLLSNIAWNFLSEDHQTKAFLKVCFDIEDCLLDPKQASFLRLQCHQTRDFIGTQLPCSSRSAD